MKKIMNLVLAATLTVCGASVFTSCTIDTSDNPVPAQAKCIMLRFWGKIL